MVADEKKLHRVPGSKGPGQSLTSCLQAAGSRVGVGQMRNSLSGCQRLRDCSPESPGGFRENEKNYSRHPAGEISPEHMPPSGWAGVHGYSSKLQRIRCSKEPG